MRRTRFDDEEEDGASPLAEPFLEPAPSALPTPFATAAVPPTPFAAAPLQPPRAAGGVLRDKHGKFRTLTDQRARTTVLINLAGILERVNEQTLPALYKYVGRSFRATPGQLGYITLACALVQAVASPFGGLLGHYFNRVTVLAAGCFLWAACSAAFALTNSVVTGAAFWAVNGVGLALLIPNAQSLIADYFKPVSRGKAFGALYLTGALGGMAGALGATNLGHVRWLGVAGWRLAFLFVAACSAVVGVLNLLFAVDPRYRIEDPQYAQDPDIFKRRPITPHRMLADVRSVLAVPSFVLIVVQGVVGSLPWQALVWHTLYFQLMGFSDFTASVLASLFMLGTAVGGLLGGVVGDWAAARSPNHGRIIAAQVSVGAGVPLAAVVYKLLPLSSGPGMGQLYGAALFMFGALISWAAPACNSPMFGEIVPAQQRTIIYSFDRAFEGAVASMGAPVVGWLAERMGFHTASDAGGGADSPDSDLESAAALSDALLLCTAIPWALCAFLYSGLHLTYRKDRLAARAYQRARSGFISTATLPAIDEEAEEESDEEEAALAALGTHRAPLPVSGRGTPIARLGRGFSRSV